MDSDIALADLQGQARVYEERNGDLRRRFRQQSVTQREFTLPPADRGKDAWLFLAGCFMVEALIWGRSLLFPLTKARC